MAHSQTHAGTIKAGEVYRLDEFMRRAGLGRKAVAAARRKGLQVSKVGTRVYVSGDEFRRFLSMPTTAGVSS